MNQAKTSALVLGKIYQGQVTPHHTNKRKGYQFAAVLLALALCIPAPRALAHGTTCYINGRWFNGQSFVEQTVYVVEGVLRMHYAGKVDTTTDLQGKYVVAPFAEAHNHHFGEEVNFKQQLNTYIKQGIFYSKNTNGITKLAASVRPLVNLPESVDVLYANGGLTATGGHPVQIFDLIANQIGWERKAMENQAYFIIDTEKDLESKWPMILAGKPDFLKTYLEYCEEYEKRKNNPEFFGKRGLNPAMLAKIVVKAHKENLPVIAHINTAADFRAAVNAGVDEITHLPLEKLTEADAREAARRGMTVVTTTISHRPIGQVQDIDGVHRHNIGLLKKAGVRLVIGTDDNNLTVINEAENLRRLAVFDNLGLLKLLTETTPQTLYPNRKIGYLKEGYEANFLALEGNPLEDFANIKKVAMRVKKGHVLEVAPEAPKLPSIANTLAHTLMGKGVAAAIAQYRQLKNEHPQDYDFSEKELNALGYQMLKSGRLDDALELFKLNVEMYPQGYNAYDSLAEAYMQKGERELAIKNYKRSLELNPHNKNAVEMLKKLE
ncbi:MAG: amidohydrolase family protein [Acidobacteriota bacterium]